jgi:uncharacterized protein (DUF697 family)
MFADGRGDRRRFPGAERLKSWLGGRYRALISDPLLRDYEDTLRRLLKGSFRDLSAPQKQERVEQIIATAALASMAMASAPLPLLELPVQVAMVRAIAKVHGRERPGRKVLWQLGGALGGGLFFRQVMRMLPLVGPLPQLSRIYGATWALGRVAHVYFAEAPGTDPAGLRRLFEETAAARTAEQSARLRRGDLEAQLRYLDDLRAREIISVAEHRRKRDELLALI